MQLQNHVKFPPKAKKTPKIFKEHGHVRTDNYYWLNDRENPEVIAYLKEENEYTETVFNVPTKSLQKKLFDEMVGRIPQKDSSVPYTVNGYTYYTRYERGKEYPVYCRKKAVNNAPEEIMLNGNKMAKDYHFFDINNWDVSPDNKIIAYSLDTVSRRQYTLLFKNLETGKTYSDKIPNTSGDIAWGNDNKTIFYSVKDTALRPYKIFRHTLGEPVKNDRLIFHEKDASFDAGVYKSKSEKFVVISSESTLSTEYRLLDADNPGGKFNIFTPRMEKVEYEIAYQGGRFLIRTNYKAKNFRLMETPLDKTGIENWKEIIPDREDVLLEEVEVFDKFFVVAERKDGLLRFRIFNTKDDTDQYLQFDEPDYAVYFDDNYAYYTDILRYGYTSLKTPNTIYDYNLNTGERELKKRQKVIGGYDPEAYVTERIYAEARDGVKVPISIVYKKGFRKDGIQPLLLYAYGSYGYSMESVFRSSRLSLLDRGFAFAIAHVRGGEEMGRRWYEEGKLLKKKNSFFDFIDCANHLIAVKYTSPKRLFAMGGSAGGLLMGAVANYTPGLFRGIIAAVPFVDVVTTMLDEDIPLTTEEYDEWGNPNKNKYYEYMLSYSPYDNVKEQDYPAILVTTGLHDSQVQYWEPAKWVAKLREMKTDNNLLLLWTNMDFGHGGASGRFEQYKEIAMEDAFMLFLLDK
ncbi:Protease II [hydrothermal vent metagenome]|uniref:Protease II n=1 Tax=hydrothermal vent metagenome TaxID=652676 RepID=A0A3B0V2X2_9ZZZZ